MDAATTYHVTKEIPITAEANLSSQAALMVHISCFSFAEDGKSFLSTGVFFKFVKASWLDQFVCETIGLTILAWLALLNQIQADILIRGQFVLTSFDTLELYILGRSKLEISQMTIPIVKCKRGYGVCKDASTKLPPGLKTTILIAEEVLADGFITAGEPLRVTQPASLETLCAPWAREEDR
jgi:hypothetical protein